ncbi:MAG: extracellular solute-binding protein [Gammaproteobacteria bacterium]|nr:extracellular solute-binding protein [Gammaproteobacteria bacterium]
MIKTKKTLIVGFFILLFALLSASPVFSHTSEAESNILRVAGWDVYADPDNPAKTIGYQAFEQQEKVIIEFTALSNLESIIEAAESTDHYDLIIVSNEGVKPLYQMGLAKPLDLTRIPNYQSLHNNLKYNAWCQFDADVYAVPWAWGPTGLLYDQEQLKEPDSWSILWDERYRNSVSVWDDVSMIWTAALSMGYKNVFNLTREQLNEVKQKLLTLNGQVFDYYDGNDQMLSYIENDNVVLLNSWFDPSRRLLAKDKKYKMIIPQEGAVGMFDSYLITTRTDSEALAYRFINHQISPAVQKQMIEITGLSPSNIETIGLLNQDEIQSLHLHEIDYFNRMILWDIMPRKHLYEEVLDEIRKDFEIRAAASAQ